MTCQVGKERAEERLKSEGGFLRSQLLGEQQSREALELQVQFNTFSYVSSFLERPPLTLPLLILQSQLSGELEQLKSQLNDAAREREALKVDKEQEREKRKNTEKELRQVTFEGENYSETIVYRLSRDRPQAPVVKTRLKRMS